MRQNQRHLVQPSGLTDRINKTFCKLNTGYYDLSSLQAGKIKSHRFCRCCWPPDGCPNPQRCRPSAWLKVGLQLSCWPTLSACVSRVTQSLSPRLVSHPATCFVHLQPCLQKVTVTADSSPLSNHCLLPLLRQSPEESCFFSQRQPPEFLYFSHWQAGWLLDYLISLLASAGERLGLIFEFLSNSHKAQSFS